MNEDKYIITATKQLQSLAYIKFKKASMYFYVDIGLKMKFTQSNRESILVCNLLMQIILQMCFDYYCIYIYHFP